jgi:hypothetical protein
MKIKVNTDFERLQLKARNALYKIEEHPAITSLHGIQQCIWFSIQPVCKRGYSQESIRGVSVYNKGKNAKRFKEQFDLEKKEDSKFYEQYPFLLKIDVPYEELFGELWKFDHIEYWGELTLKVYNPKPTHNNDYDRWDNWAGPHSSGRTYEEMIINLWKALKKDYGDFGYNSFMTPEELKNNKENEIFFFKEVEDHPAYGKCSEMVANPNFIRVLDAEKNIRWQKWMKDNKNKTFDNN